MNADSTPKPDRSYTLSDFDYALPPELIAQHPPERRTASRLLEVVSEAQKQCELKDKVFSDLPSLLRAGDLLVLNDTKVVKARLFGHKATGGKIELLIERVLQEDPRQVIAHMKVSKKPQIGDVLTMGAERCGNGMTAFQATLLGRWPDENGGLFRFAFEEDAYQVMERCGHLPLPPYIEHADDEVDAERYQTVFAKHPGAVAAPTAALHFDEALFAELEARGVERAYVTLHVGAGTFSPVKTEDIRNHQMHFERYHIPLETEAAIAKARERGGRVIAVGTTSVRTLESWAKTGLSAGDTNIFITPGFAFQVVDAMLTNFHLPKSTLMMLVSAFAGYDCIRKAYDYAIAQRYRFFSYGDAMLLYKQNKMIRE